MCLVKEPTKRPTAEKLLRHSFFKHARTSDYIYRHVLEDLPSLGERVKNLKVGVKVSQLVRVDSVFSCEQGISILDCGLHLSSFS